MKIKIRNEKSAYNCFMFIFGMFSTMPILSIFGITMYVWGIVICGLIALLDWIRYGIKISKNTEISYIIMSILTCVSYYICISRMPEKWKNGIGTAFIQFILTLIIYVYFLSLKNKQPLKKFVYGVYVSSIFQMIWGYAQIIFNYMGKDLNNLVFKNILHMVSDSATQYQFGNLKVSGLCWNAGNLAPLVIFGYVYTNSIYLKILFVILSILSGSRTMMLGILFCLVLETIIRLKNKGKLSAKKILIFILAAILCVGFILINWNTTILFFNRIAGLLNITNNIKREGSTNTHYFYLSSIIRTTKLNDILSNLFGYGPGCSGYVFSHFYGYYVNSPKWSVECDYVNRLWNYGYFGTLVYYYWYIKNVFLCKKIDSKYIVLFVTLLFEGLFYNITFNWVSLLITFIFILEKENENIFLM